MLLCSMVLVSADIAYDIVYDLDLGVFMMPHAQS